MTRPFRRFVAVVAMALLAPVLLLAGCRGTSRGPVLPGAVPSAAPGSLNRSVQELYESGRYLDVLSASAGSAHAETLWFAAHSSLRLGQRDEAARHFARLREVGGNAAWGVVADLALALLAENTEAIDRARTAAAAFADSFVQFELGLAHARRDDIAQAAQAFDRCTEADPRFAYAYYNAGLAHERLNRKDLAIARLEMFERLAPNAPERPEVSAILKTVRGR